MHVLDGKRVLITGGTGSLGKVLLRRLLGGGAGDPAKIIVLSRDEAKQHAIRVEYQRRSSPTDEVIYDNSSKKLEFRIGDVRGHDGHAPRFGAEFGQRLHGAAVVETVA